MDNCPFPDVSPKDGTASRPGHALSRRMEDNGKKMADLNARAGTTGRVLHAAAAYDLLVWLFTFGRERAFREKILRLARLEPGESVLDLGCGTGSLAVAAKRQLGTAGTVYGIDRSPEMLARADKKARKAGVDVVFTNAAAQALPFPDGQFDIVLSTLVLHHLPKKGREEFAGEAIRVLRPGGRLLLVDFAKPPHQRSVFRFHRHGHVDLERVAADLVQHGFAIVERGNVGTKGLRYLVAQPDLWTTVKAR